jgi:hypothetical protein
MPEIEPIWVDVANVLVIGLVAPMASPVLLDAALKARTQTGPGR